MWARGRQERVQLAFHCSAGDKKWGTGFGGEERVVNAFSWLICSAALLIWFISS